MGGETFLKLQPNGFHTGVNRKCLSNTGEEEEEEEEEPDGDGLCVADTLPLNHQHLLLAAGVRDATCYLMCIKYS